MSVNSQVSAKKLTIIVNTCDAYSDVLPLFFAAFHEFWPNCPYDILINSESNIYPQYQAKTHTYIDKYGHNRWGERLIKTLVSIDSEYVFMLYDDFILEKQVIQTSIDEVLMLLQRDITSSVAYLINTALPIKNSHDDRNFALVEDYAEYRLNSAPAIWRRSDLLDNIGVNDTPWAWEVFGSYRTFGNNKKYYTLKPDAEDIYFYNYQKGGAIYRGKWVKDVVAPKIIKYNLNLNLDVRGVSADYEYEARTLKWKIDFIILGFKMVGFKCLRFIHFYIKAKFNASKT